MSQLIRNWEELSKIPNESKTHILEVNLEMCNGHLWAKNRKPYKRKLSYEASTSFRPLSFHAHILWKSV